MQRFAVFRGLFKPFLISLWFTLKDWDNSFPWVFCRLCISHMSQCGNLKIFLPPRFYVKSNLAILGSRKLLFWPFRRPIILNFQDFQHFYVKVSQKSKCRGSKKVKIAISELQKLTKFDFT